MTFRTKLLVIPSVGLALLGLVVLVVLLIRGPKVAIVNDLGQEVSLWSCQGDPFDLAAGEERKAEPMRPCIVRTAGNEPLGCLLFRREAFEEGATTLLSEMDTTLDENECTRREDYVKYYRLW
jgi:hypothetical protein